MFDGPGVESPLGIFRSVARPFYMYDKCQLALKIVMLPRSSDIHLWMEID